MERQAHGQAQSDSCETPLKHREHCTAAATVAGPHDPRVYQPRPKANAQLVRSRSSIPFTLESGSVWIELVRQSLVVQSVSIRFDLIRVYTTRKVEPDRTGSIPSASVNGLYIIKLNANPHQLPYFLEQYPHVKYYPPLISICTRPFKQLGPCGREAVRSAKGKARKDHQWRRLVQVLQW